MKYKTNSSTSDDLSNSKNKADQRIHNFIQKMKYKTKVLV